MIISLCLNRNSYKSETGHEANVRDKEGNIHTYNSGMLSDVMLTQKIFFCFSDTSPLIFIGGHPRPGPFYRNT